MKLEAALVVRCLNKSEAARIIGESMTNVHTKQFMMSVAVDYLMLAEMVEDLLRNDLAPAAEPHT